MRIVAGSARGRRIEAPAGRDTRPTTDRVREAIFNSLTSLGAVEGATAIDLFAGSGALGLEALSRGAARVTFVDTDRRAQRVIAANLANLDLADRATIIGTEALAYLAGVDPVDLLLCDPPYEFDEWERLLAMAPASVVVCESDREVVAPDRWRVAKQKRYGTSVVTILTAEPPE